MVCYVKVIWGILIAAMIYNFFTKMGGSEVESFETRECVENDGKKVGKWSSPKTVGKYKEFDDYDVQNYTPLTCVGKYYTAYNKVGIDGVNGQSCHLVDGKMVCDDYYGIYDRSRALRQEKLLKLI